MNPSRACSFSYAALITLTAFAIAGTAQTSANDYNWTGGIDGDWNDAGNWDIGIPGNFNHNLIFSGTTNTATNNDITNSFGNITLSNTTAGQSFSLGGNQLNLYGTVSTAAVVGGGTIEDTISLNLRTTAGTRTFNMGTDHNLTVSGVITGPQGIIKTGDGRLTLTAVNNHGGSATINGGTLAFAGGGTTAEYIPIVINNTGTLRFDRNDTWGNATTDTSSSITINAGGTMESGGYFTTIRDLNLNGGTVAMTGGVNATYPALALKGTVTVGGSQASQINIVSGSNNMISIGDGNLGATVFDVADSTSDASADLTVSTILQNNSPVGGNSLTKTGAGTMELTAANTYSGTTTISAGTLQLGDGGTNGSLSTSSAISVASGATFAVNQSDTVTQGTDFRGASITGAGGFTQSGSGTTILNVNNGYTGDTNVDGGVLEYQSTASFFVLASDNFNINNGSTLRFSVNGGNGFVMDAGDTINFDSNGGGLMDVASGNFVVRGTTITTQGGTENTIQGSFNMDQSGAVIFNVADGTDANDLNVSALLVGASGILKQGAGTMLATNVTYTGATTVDSGVLVLDESDSTYHGGAININNGATLRLDNQTGTYLFGGDSFNFGATGGNTLEIVSGHNHVWSGNNTVTTNGGTGNTMTGSNINTNAGGAAGTLTFNIADGTDASDLTVSTTISNEGSINKIGLGTLTFTGANSYSGTTTVNAGTLSLASGSSHSGSGAYTVNGGILEIATGVDLSGHAMTIGLDGVISPGNSPGTAATGAQTWLDGGSYLWEINNSDGTKGVDEGWDWLDITGTLDLTGLSAGGFTIDIDSLTSGNIAGDAVGFDTWTKGTPGDVDYSFIIATASSGITGFDADNFTLDSSGFSNAPSWEWGIVLSGSDLVLEAYAVPEPSSTALLGLGGIALILRRKK